MPVDGLSLSGFFLYSNIMTETFYFSHDYNSRTDEKIKRLIRKHGMLGYGLFWAIVEDLYNNANVLRTDYDGIAYELHIDTETIRSIINDFNLFEIKDNEFGSLSVQSRLDKRVEKSDKARKSANKRWSNNANAMRTQCDSNAIKERKGKENKGKDRIFQNFILFSESKWNYETTKSFLLADKEKSLRYNGADLKHYISKVSNWSDGNTKKKNEKEWIFMVLRFMDDDLGAGKLKMMGIAQNKYQQDRL